MLKYVDLALGLPPDVSVDCFSIVELHYDYKNHSHTLIANVYCASVHHAREITHMTNRFTKTIPVPRMCEAPPHC